MVVLDIDLAPLCNVVEILQHKPRALGKVSKKKMPEKSDKVGLAPNPPPHLLFLRHLGMPCPCNISPRVQFWAEESDREKGIREMKSMKGMSGRD